MLDHLGIQCADVAVSAAFYDAVLAPLGAGRLMDFGEFIGYGIAPKPDFWLGPNTGEGFRESHIAFEAADRATVRAFFDAAVGAGAEVLHEPRVWPEYHPNYYGAFVRDPDGNNVEAVCHAPEEQKDAPMPAIDVDQYTGVKLHKDGKVLTATLTNPEKRNAMTPAMSNDLDRLWGDVDRDEDVNVVVLTGAGDAFCAGVDLGNVSRGESTTGKVTSRSLGKEIRDRFWKMLDCETPIISKVRGPAYGLGASICLSADIVVASENARFADSHVRMGIAAGDGGVALWPLLVGFHRAKEFLMLGDVIPAQRAEEIGLINHCVPDDELDGFVDEMARRLADGAPRAISWTKLAMNILLKQLTAGAFEASVAYDLMTLRMDDAREGSTAFMEKRAPRFTGD